MQKVIVLGGGMGGLCTAYELACRGFSVEIYEKLPIFGGKARSFSFPGTGKDGRPDLPAEHGFRVFPGWYAHVSDTMARIPYTGRGAKPGQTVVDRLVKVPYLAYAIDNEKPFYFTTSKPSTVEEWLAELHAIFHHEQLGLRREDGEFFLRQMLKFLGSSEERRLGQYELTDWFKYIEADRSESYERVCANGLTRSLVATRPRKASTYTVATILIQMLYTMLRGDETDRILDGPTSDVWIDSWVREMRENPDLDVTFHSEAVVRSLAFEGGRVTSAEIALDGETRTVTGDTFVLALPVEIVRKLLSEDQLKEAGLIPANPGDEGPDLNKLEVAWMNGIMYYARKDAAMVKGHVIYIDSPWALTSVSQAQFWADEYQLHNYGDGTVKDILSAIISEWESEKNPAKEAKSREEIKQGAWKQIEVARSAADQGNLTEADIALSYLDPDIQDVDPYGSIRNTEPLLTNTAGSIRHRPEAQTKIANLVLSSDYVNTYTNLATMEGANEAGRRAANAVLDATGWQGERALVTPLQEPKVFDHWKEKDRKAYEKNPHSEPPIAKYVDLILGKTGWFYERLIALDLWLAGNWLWETVLGWFTDKSVRDFLRHRARARKALTEGNA